jgi:SAM-dependent methyltransferase
MPTITENRAIFEDYAWPEGGDEWSREWGSSRMFFFGTVMPRIARFVPCENILEIAPGYGRCTQYLIGMAERTFTAVDLAANCVEACRARFAHAPHARFQLGDGKSLPFLEDASVDFAFSFDSLVHADAEAMRGYLSELARTLRPGAYAFIHHSNLGAYVDAPTVQPTVPNPEFRDPTVSAEALWSWSTEAGLACLAQELVNWHSPHYTDCISLLRRSEVSGAPIVSRHPDLAGECRNLRRIDELFDQA